MKGSAEPHESGLFQPSVVCCSLLVLASRNFAMCTVAATASTVGGISGLFQTTVVDCSLLALARRNGAMHTVAATA